MRKCFGFCRKERKVQQAELAPEFARFSLVKVLGEGSSGRVYLGKKREDGELIAVKRMRKDKTAPKRLEAEIFIMKTLFHPNVISLYFFEETDKYHYIGMEYGGERDLFDVLYSSEGNRLCEAEAAHYCRQILSALAYIHSKNILHRDVKLENVLVSERKVVKLTDFGLAKLHDGSMSSRHTLCGSLSYLAPEVHNLEVYGPAADVWSFGVVAYCCVQGFMPYFERIQPPDFDWSKRAWDVETSEECKHFVDCCLEVESEERPSAAEAAKHLWLS